MFVNLHLCPFIDMDKKQLDDTQKPTNYPLIDVLNSQWGAIHPLINTGVGHITHFNHSDQLVCESQIQNSY